MTAMADNSRSADVIIIGGGVIGCAVAFRLAQSRLKVLVLERDEFGKEASSAAAGMIAPQGEVAEFDDFFKLCAASRDLYPTFVEELEGLNERGVHGEGLGYRRDGTLVVATTEHEGEELQRMYEAQACHGLPLELLQPGELHGHMPELSSQIRFALLIRGDHRIDNERLTPALVAAGKKLGASYMAQTVVTKLNIQGSRIAALETTKKADNSVTLYSAGTFILAAGCWSGELIQPIGMLLPVAPCRGQIIEFETDLDIPFAVRAGRHYIVPRAPHRILAGTTAEYVGHEKAVTAEGLRSILENVCRFAPFMGKLKFRRAWAGLRPDTPDHLPILGGGVLDNLIFATGHFRNGILLTPITAQIIAELVVTGSASRPINNYRPNRFSEVAQRHASRS
jgi:glycine oxidase